MAHACSNCGSEEELLISLVGSTECSSGTGLILGVRCGACGCKSQYLPVVQLVGWSEVFRDKEK
jgi:hypothetical protein